MLRKWCFFSFLIILIPLSVQSREYHFIGQDYEPFNWIQDGELTGGMFDIVKSACLKMKVKCVFDILPMKRVTLKLEEGSTDGVLSLIKNPDREKYSILSIPIIKSSMSLHAMRGAYGPHVKLSDLKGKTIGVTASSSAAKLAEKLKAQLGELEIVYEVSLPNAIKKLSAKRYGSNGLALSNEDVTESFMKKNGITNVETIYDVEVGKFGVAFSKKNVDAKFIEEFNKTITIMKKSGEIKRILQPYSLEMDL